MYKPTKVNKELSEKFPHDYFDDRIKIAIKLLQKNSNSKYLDIGCSNGAITNLIAGQIGTKQIFGLDVANINDARLKGINASEFDLNNDDNLPYGDNFFDVITCFDTLEHIYNTDHLIREMHRILKSDGYALITVPRTDSIVNFVLLVLGYQPMNSSCSLERNFGSFSDNRISGHMSHFTKKALIEMCKFYGFRIVLIRGASCAGAWLADQKVATGNVSFLKKMIAFIINLIPFKKEALVLKIIK